MARPGVTYHDIASVANQLKGQGKNITIENVRAMLGTGSISTINQHLRKWKEAQIAAPHFANKENLPENLILLVKGLWENIIIQSAEKFLPIEEKYQKNIALLQSELEKYKHNNQRWQKLFSQWQEEKATLENEKLTLKHTLDFAHQENQSLHTQQNGSRKQLDEKQARIDELHQLHQQVQHNLEHYRESAREQRLLDQQQFEREKQQLFLEVRSLKEEKAKDLQMNAALNKKLLALQYIQQQYQSLENEHATLVQTHQKTHQTWLILEERYKQQETMLSNKESEITIFNNKLIEAEKQIAILTAQSHQLKNQLQQTEDKVENLRQEKLFLAQEKSELQGYLKQLDKTNLF